MKRILAHCGAAMAMAVALAAGANETATARSVPPADRDRAAAAWAAEGLQPVDARGLDLVFIRPGLNLAPYRAILIKPVSVSFQEAWARNVAIPSGTRLRPRDLENTRADVAATVRARVAREFERGGYAMADSPGADVLELEVQVVDLYLNAPDLATATPTRSFTTSFGELTLVAALRDSRSGATLVRTMDRSVGRDYGAPRVTTRVENAYEVGGVASVWARALRGQLALAGLAHGGSNDRP